MEDGFVGRFTEWSSRTTRNLIISLSGLWGAAILLLFLAAWIPSTITRGAVLSARETVTAAHTHLTTLEARYDTESKWPKPDYTKGLAGNLGMMKRWLADYEWKDETETNTFEGADFALAKASGGEWNPDAVVFWANTARDSARKADELGAVVQAKLDENAKLQSDARSLLAQTDNLFSTALRDRDNVAKRLQTEREGFLSKYAVALDSAIVTAGTSQSNGQQSIDAARDVMPDATDTRAVGDPLTAITELTKAKAEIDKINTLTGQVTAGLDLQKEAKANADPKTREAQTAVATAWTTIQNVADTRGYTLDKSLALANNLYHQADDKWKNAASTLVNPIAEEGGKLDYLLAYESAIKAIELSGNVNTEVKTQTDTADQANAKIGQYPGVYASVNAVVDQANGDLSRLSAYHAQDTWTEVASAVDSAKELMRQAQIHIDDAKKYVSLQYQQFVDALSQATKALQKLSNAQSTAQNLITRFEALENLRLVQWPSAESSAVSAISSAEPTVVMYTGYSSRAVVELSNARSSLSNARSYILQLRWQNAVNAAHTAVSQANNAATWARADYNAEMDRQREEAAARQRAIEEAQRQQQQLQNGSHYSGSNDYSSPSMPSDNNSWNSGGASDNNSW